MNNDQFQLVLEGFTEDSPEALRKVKGALLADVGLSVTEAQAVLQSLPFTLCSASNEGELAALYGLLARAGARVLIVHPDEERSEPLDPALDFFVAGEQAPKAERNAPEETAVIETGLDFFVETPASPPPMDEPTQPTETFLSDTSELSLDLSPAPDLPPLKETLVEAEPEDVELAPVEEHRESMAPPAPIAPPTEGPSAPIPAVETRPVTPTVPATPRFAEVPHNVPIGRRMREAEASNRSHDANTLLHEQKPGPQKPAILSPAVIGTVVGGIIALGLLNWWIYGM